MVEPGISTASFKEWGEGKVRIIPITNHQLCLVALYLLVFLFLKNICCLVGIHVYHNLITSHHILNCLPCKDMDRSKILVTN